MKHIIVGSGNKVKVEAALRGFQKMFPSEEFGVEGIVTASGVSVQPLSDHETLTGAKNRAFGARTAKPDADYWLGIEGGLEERERELLCFAWVVILANERESCAKTGTFVLPPGITELIKEGHELGLADDLFFSRSNSKQDNGSVGILTGDVITRTGYYEQAVILALIPVLRPDLYGA